MKISLNWLKEFVEIPTDVTPQEIGEKLTLHTAEVEGVESEADAYKGMVIGKVVALKKHPGADRLNLAQVDIGTDAPVQIVCGGVNLVEDMLVPVAPPGSWVRWHGEGELTELKETKIRGEKSYGMICAGEEIGLETDNPDPNTTEPRIKDLSHLDAKPGDSLAEALGKTDAIFDIDNKSLTHRPDLWGHYGIARELAAIFDVPLKPFESILKFKEENPSESLKITIQDNELCPRFSGCLITNLETKESPTWMKNHLEACGIRAINNIVDVTNYLSLEIGQPMHAYDRQLMKTDHLEVRYAKEGEIFETIDHKKRTLSSKDPLVTNGKVAADLAGIMGGADSEIQDNTTEIILEAANWNPIMIRKASMRHNLRSDASQRFEKGIDPALTEWAIKRAIDLLRETCPDLQVITPLTTVGTWTPPSIKISVNPQSVCDKIGTEIPVDEMTRILKALEFEVAQKGDELEVAVPSHRATGDVKIEEDIVEEIGRIYGYETIEPIIPHWPIQLPIENQERFDKHATRRIFAYELGFSETMSYSFYSEEDFKQYGLEDMRHIRVKNALSSEQTHMRISLIPNLMKCIVKNHRQRDTLKLFEIGHTYLECGEFMPLEEKWVAGAIIDQNPKTGDIFYAIKGAVEAYLTRFGSQGVVLKEHTTPPPYAHPQKCLDVMVKGKSVGAIFALHPGIQTDLDLEYPIGLFELNFTKLVDAGRKLASFKPLPKFPSMPFDISVLVDQRTPIGNIERAIKKGDKEGLVKGVKLFDIYEGDKIPAGKKSLAFNLELRHDDHTLTDEEFHQTQQSIFRAIEKIGGEIRGN